MWCCKGCISIIKEDNNATYEEIRVKVENKAAALPKLTGESANPLQKAEAAVEAAEAAAEPLPVVTGESADPLQKAEAAVEAAEAAMKAAVTRAEAAEARRRPAK